VTLNFLRSNGGGSDIWVPRACAGHIAIVIDDGIATGATMRAALRVIRARRPRKLVLPVPVAPTSTLVELQNDADDIICLEDYEVFGAIGIYYANFRQVSDQKVIDILKAARCANEAADLIQVKALLAGWINLPAGFTCLGGCHERSGSRKHRTYRSAYA
jgi:hypothetical protein